MPPKKKKIVNTTKSTGELVFREDDQKYAHIIKPLGDRRFQIVTEDGRVGVGKLRGNMRRRDMVITGMKVLLSERWNDGKFDILLKYDDKQTKMLKKYGELNALEKAVLDWQRSEDERLYGASTHGDNALDSLVDFEEADDNDEFIDII
jgi:initiation factor 1A